MLSQAIHIFRCVCAQNTTGGFQAVVEQPSRDDLLLSPSLAYYLHLLCEYECEQENVSVMVHRVSSTARSFLCPYLGWVVEGKEGGAIRSRARGNAPPFFFTRQPTWPALPASLQCVQAPVPC